MPPKKAAPKAKEEPKAISKEAEVPEAKAKPEPEPNAKAKAEPKAKAKAEPEAKPKAKAKAEPEAKPKAKSQATPKKEEPEKKPSTGEKRPAPSSKAEAKKEEPPTKKLKKEDSEAPAETSEKDKEQEQDAPADKRPAIKGPVVFHPMDCTLNVVATMYNKVLMALTEGGMQYLVAGARASIGMKAGRYTYEVRIVEALNPAESSASGASGRVPAPRQLLRVGFSTAGSNLVLGESEEHIFFDAEGAFCVGKKKTLHAAQKFTREQILAVMLNLDPSSPNANTLSLFRDGERISEPQKLPETLHGKTFFPHITFRNVSVQVLMDAAPTKPLPFKCRTLATAAQADVVVTQGPKDGKCEVVFPVGVPDEGLFQWVDGFLANNPDFVELSDRSLLKWAQASGMTMKAGTGKGSNDKPEFNFGLPGMDNMSARRVLQSSAPLMPRNYVVMELQANLVQAERKEALQRFSLPHFKKIARVAVGEPDEEFKNLVLAKRLEEKKAKADIVWQVKKQELKKKKDMEKRQKELAKMRKKAEEARKKRAEETKKKLEEMKQKAAAAKKKAEDAKKPKEEGAEEAKMDVDEEEAKKEEEEVKEEKPDEPEGEEAEEPEVEEPEPEQPEVELTEEEKANVFVVSGGVSDLTVSALSTCFTKFSLPSKSEGFDDVIFEWQNEAKSKEYLQKWVMDKKKSCRIEDLKPGDWFEAKLKEWTKSVQLWQAKQKTFRASQAVRDKEAAKKKAEEKKKRLAEAKEAGLEGLDDVEEEEVGPAEVDIYAVENVADVGEGVPLFKDFTFEDWALAQLRFELYTLVKAFGKDVKDEDRNGVPDTHFAFYYGRYFRKTLTPKHFGVGTLDELVALVPDTVSWEEGTKVLAATLDEEVENPGAFIKCTEEARRERQRRIDAGDETARLKFSPLAMSGMAVPKPSPVTGGRPVGGSITSQWGSSASATGATPSPKGWQRPLSRPPPSTFRPAGTPTFGVGGVPGVWAGKGGKGGKGW